MAGRFSQFAAAAAKQAVSDSELEHANIPADRIKVSVGTSMSGLIDVQQPTFAAFLRGEEVWPWACLEFPSHAATSHVAILNQACGQSATFATA